MIVDCLLVDCPVCGRPLKGLSQWIGREVTCSHCCGRFELRDTVEGPGAPVAVLAGLGNEGVSQIEPILTAQGIRVVLAETANQALKLCRDHKPILMLADTQLPDQNGWLLAVKLRIVDNDVQIWLYSDSPTGFDRGAAKHLPVDAFAQSLDDLRRLCESIGPGNEGVAVASFSANTPDQAAA